MDVIEKSLLFGVVRDKAWGTLLSNGMLKEYFSYANQPIYSYIKDNLDRGQYPDLYTMAYAFHIDDYNLQEYLAVENLEELCDLVRKAYASQLLNNKIAMLNENINEMDTDPYKFIDRLVECTNSLKHISTKIKSVSLLDDIDDIVTIDETDTISSGFKELDMKLRGWKRGEDLIVFVGRTGQGKEQPLSAKVLTPTGWKCMNDIHLGDVVIGGDGFPTNVIGEYPQGVKDVYRIDFSDGTSAECGLEHLWHVKMLQSNKKRKYINMTLAEMLGVLKDKQPNTKSYRKMFAVDYVPSNIEFKNEIMGDDINPYIIGALIGDGCLTHRNEVLISINSRDIDIMDRINLMLPDNYTLNKYGSDDYRIIRKNSVKYNKFTGKGMNDIGLKLSELGLMGKHSYEKFIPHKYLYSSVENRILLLQGLCDTDGCSSDSNVQYFETTSKQLALDFKELVMSLGCRVSMCKKSRGYKNKNGIYVKCRDAYAIGFSIDFNPYYTKFKANRWKPYRQLRHKFITNIVKVRKEESKCIMLDNAEHTYITNEYTITHNTWFGLKFAMSAAMSGEKVGIYSGEMSKQQLQERILCCAKKTYTSTREEALQFIKDSNIDIRLLTQADLRRKANIDDIEEFIVREKLTMLVIDQLSLMEDNTCKPRHSITTTIWKYIYGFIYIIN